MGSGNSGGDWLFRQEGLVLGPVPGSRLIEMLNAGEIDGRTEIAPMGSSAFKRLAEVDFFKVHYAKAEAKRRVDLSAAADRAVASRRRNVKIAVIGGIALLLATGAAVAAQYLAIHNPWKDSDELAFADISVDAPTITVARAHVADEELIEYPSGTRPASGRTTPSRSASGSSAGKPAGTTPAAAAATAASAGSGSGARTADKPDRPKAVGSTTQRPRTTVDDDGLEMAQFDQAAINSVVASKQKTLYPCFMEEAKRTPGFAARIPLEFVIGNEGRVVKLWVDHPRYKTGPLYECLFAELKKWPFKAYDGERATVNLSFNIGKKR